MANQNLSDLKSSFNDKTVKKIDDLRNIADSTLNLNSAITQVTDTVDPEVAGQLFLTASDAFGGDGTYYVLCVSNGGSI